MRALLLIALSTLPVLAANQILLRSLDPSDGTPQALAADGAGNLFVVTSINATPPLGRVIKLDSHGVRLASLDVPNGEYLWSAAADAQGNLIAAGTNSSSQGIVVKLDSQLHGVLFSKSLPGSIWAVAVDGSGNIYVTGSTTSTAFPVTPGAYQTKPPGQTSRGAAAYAFLAKISPAGDQLLYSTYFGDDATICTYGLPCSGVVASTTASSIAVDPSGAIVIAGSTTAAGLPTTPGALSRTCVCTYQQSAGFVAKFQPAASQQLQ